MVSRPCALGLVGLVCLLIGNAFAMMCLNLACFAAACEECMFEHENVEHEESTHPRSLGLVLHGHTCLSRIHTTVQCLTKFKGLQKRLSSCVCSIYPWSCAVSVRLALGLVLYGHTYLSRVHTTVQCMTMFKGTVDGKKFAKGIHAVRHATIPVKNPLSPSHSMLTENDNTEREGVRTT